MNNLVRFTCITLLLAAATLLTLAVGGVLSSDELWNNMAKVAELIGILFVTAGGILLLSKTKS
jgi:hypothetical protein